jgi:hypothetical protein
LLVKYNINNKKGETMLICSKLIINNNKVVDIIMTRKKKEKKLWSTSNDLDKTVVFEQRL